MSQQDAGLSDLPGCLKTFGDAPALFEPATARQWRYCDVAAEVERGANVLAAAGKKLVFLFGGNDAESVFAYLSVLATGHALHLCPGRPGDPAALELIARYRPEILLWRGESLPGTLSEDYHREGAVFGFSIFGRPAEGLIHPDVALLLSTSGSIGRPKLAKLSLAGVMANTGQIIAGLGIGASDRSAMNLPLGHLSGMAVLNSHLAAGGSLVIEKRSVLERGFWQSFAEFGVTSLPGVPFTYKMLKEMRIEAMDLSSLRKLTFAAGRLPTDIGLWLCETFMPRGISLYSMYGQTEAGRISILAPELAREKLGSVGKPLPPTQVDITAEGELVCHGPGVMLGYSRVRDDLALGDEMGGVVHTGDLGRFDSDGFLTITGRMSRFCKIVGERIDLGDIESFFENTAAVAAISDDERIVIFHEPGPDSAITAQASALARQLRIPRHHIVTEKIAALPRSGSGKISYGVLKEAWSRAG
jgi:acyl-coenzyme A synthetase/AMP-(fatty) acid ligase